jgi:hypothetical protein
VTVDDNTTTDFAISHNESGVMSNLLKQSSVYIDKFNSSIMFGFGLKTTMGTLVGLLCHALLTIFGIPEMDTIGLCTILAVGTGNALN